MNNELFRDLESMTIGLDDTFKFHCDQCGKCCTHREDIILSPMDIYKMAKELKMTPVEFYHEYCVFNIGEHTRMPSEEVSKWPILTTYINGTFAMSTIMRFRSVKMSLWLRRLHR